MRIQMLARELSETPKLRDGLRASEPFTVRRSQITLSNARGETAPRIAAFLGCDEQTVPNQS